MDQNLANNENSPFKLEEVDLDEQARTELEPSVDSANIAEKSMSKSVEKGANSNPLTASPPPIKPVPVDPSAFLPVDPAAPVQQAKQIQVITDNLQASDADLIEKAWVVKAKAIVDKTKNDPHTQAIEIKKIKADYQKKRFNKELKIDD